ncbi:MAG: hypothetical protein IJQ07_02360 [Clostridia bacterium]|nr:hypothetical protein [Clostridia bacterium]
MTKRSSGNIFSFLTALLVIAVIVLGGSFLYKFTNGFNEELKTFYVTINDKEVISSANGYTVSPKSGLTVKVKYTFGAPDNADKHYSVKVASNYDKEKNFDFTVDGKTYSFGAGEDYTAGFDITYGKDYFILKPKGYINDVLRAVYADKQVSDCANKEFKDMFTLTVYSYNGESSVTVLFTIKHTITGISLDKEEVKL